MVYNNQIMTNMKYNWQKEIEDLHVFFENWLAGKAAKTEEVYSRFSDSVDDSFNLISPNGVSMSRKELLPSLYQSHGKRKDVQIWTKKKKLLAQNGDILVVSYEEWQKENNEDRGIVSSAVFIIDPEKPNGVRWLHVHETWID